MTRTRNRVSLVEESVVGAEVPGFVEESVRVGVEESVRVGVEVPALGAAALDPSPAADAVVVGARDGPRKIDIHSILKREA